MAEKEPGDCCVKNYTTSCVTDNKGMDRDSLSLFDIPKQGKIDLIKVDMDSIKEHLMSFVWFVTLSNNIKNIYELRALIDIAKIKLSDLDIYWNEIKSYIVTEELKKQTCDLNNSNTVPCHMNQEIADLYSTYANTKQRLQSEILRYQNALDTWDEGTKQIMELEMKFKGFNGNDIADENPNSEYYASDSESVISNSGSESTSEFYIDCDKSDSSESFFNTDIINADLATKETTVDTPLNNNARFRRMKYIAFTFYLIVIILWLVGWLEPQCCDSYKWSFEISLRYLNGPPPT